MELVKHKMFHQERISQFSVLSFFESTFSALHIVICRWCELALIFRSVS